MSTTNEHSGAVAYPEIWNVAEFAIRCVLQTITRDRRLGPRHDARQTLKSFQLYAGTHVAFARSYLYPAAVLRASFVVFIVSHLSPFLSVAWTLSNGTATCFSPMPRKPPTATTKAAIFPSLFTKTSLSSPIFVSEGSYMLCLYQF